MSGRTDLTPAACPNPLHRRGAGLFALGIGALFLPCGYPATPSPPPASVSINFSYSATGTRPVTFELGHKTIDSKGHPVFVGLVADTTAPNGPEPPPFSIAISAAANQFSNWQISIVRDSKFTVMSFVEITVIPVRPRNTPTFMEAPYSTVAIDVPESGQHTYTVSISGYGSIAISGARIIAYEL